GAVLIELLARLRAANPNALFCLDPVMGDTQKGLYVRPEIPAFFAGHALPLADIVMPNAFEAELLTGIKADTIEGALEAAQALRRRGPTVALVTGIAHRNETTAEIGALALGPNGAWFAASPTLDVPAHGAGDCFAALFLARYLKTRNTKK